VQLQSKESINKHEFADGIQAFDFLINYIRLTRVSNEYIVERILCESFEVMHQNVNHATSNLNQCKILDDHPVFNRVCYGPSACIVNECEHNFMYPVAEGADIERTVKFRIIFISHYRTF